MIGQIDLKRRQETSCNGVAAAVLKSAIQKYARRGMLEQGLACLTEMDLFSLVEARAEGAAEYVRLHPGKLTGAEARSAAVRRATALRTNMLNRLVVMVSEEISISTWWLPLVADRLASAWKDSRKREDARKHLVDLYKYLVAARKVRLISDLKSVYLLPPDSVKPKRRRELHTVHAELVRSLGLDRLYEGQDRAPEDLLDACTAELRPFLDGADEELCRIVNGVLFNLKHQKDHVFYWVNRLIDRQRGPKGEPRFEGRKNPLNLLWHLAEEFARKREGLWGEQTGTYPENFARLGEVIAVLRKWYDAMSHREKPIYLYHALLLIVRRRQIDWASQPPAIDTPREEVEGQYRARLEGRRIDLDPFVLDMHTGVVEPGARTRFALEGALVVNEDVTLRNDAYRTIYTRLKERLDALEDGR